MNTGQNAYTSTAMLIGMAFAVLVANGCETTTSGDSVGWEPHAHSYPTAHQPDSVFTPTAEFEYYTDATATPSGTDEATARLGFTNVEVLFATDRNRAEPPHHFGPDRGARLRYGSAAVSIPATHHRGELESPFWPWTQEHPEDHIMIMRVQPLDWYAFLDHIKWRLSKELADNAIMVFVHGYRVSFVDAVRRTGQLKYDLDFRGPAIAYSWPSNAELKDYVADESDAQWSTMHLKRFLIDLRRNNAEQKIVVIAHSMGGRILTTALKEIRYQIPEFRIDEVILAAPDIDAAVFEKQIAPAVRQVVSRMTLYASSEDQALIASREIHGGYRRVGDSSTMTIADGMDSIDVSGIDTSLIGHFAYGTGPVISDMSKLIRFGHSPRQRGLVAVPVSSHHYWKIRD